MLPPQELCASGTPRLREKYLLGMSPPRPRLPESGEPIAIIGMACRFPGANDMEAFWRLLEAGGHAVTEGTPGSGIGRVGELFPDPEVQSVACRFGAYLDDLAHFDASFFRISPVEVQLLDPQQRMMLETSWRALEDAGIDPEALKGSRTGVYAGISNNEYRGLVLDVSDTSEPAASLYSVTGTSFNTAIGRVAYALGLEGPAIALDTACSSSLVAIHQAVSGLQRGDADLALAGGVHAILSGRLLEMRATAGMLSPDGRCATFDAAANGYVRGEGCGIVILKRLREAEEDGDRIWGVVRGAAVNQDGASPGLTVPSGPAQERVMADALRRAGLEPSDVDYVEAHGTGTEVGDPIEANSTGAAYGEGRDHDDPLLIGSVKTNIGHLEAAAGVAGVMKVVLAMRHRTIPRHLHFRTPSPRMDWSRLPLAVTAEQTAWPRRTARPPTAGVSGFGWSGTNAHVVLEGYEAEAAAHPSREWRSPPGAPVSVPAPARTNVALRPRPARLLPLSGRSEETLRRLAGRYPGWLDARARELSVAEAPGGGLLADMAWTAGIGRAHFSHRAGIVFREPESLREGLRALAEGEAEVPVDPVVETPKVAFAYTGQASQWVGMGRQLYQTEPVVREVLDRCEAAYGAKRDASLLDAMFGAGDAPADLDHPAWKQPAIYALECALTALWASIGIRPDVVIGHSLGEIAAAQAADVFGLEDGLRFAADRGTRMADLPGEGAMAAIFAPATRVVDAVARHNATSAGPGVSVAADNGAHQAVSGPADDVEALLQRFEEEDVRVRRLCRSPAYHSALIEPALNDLEASLNGFDIASPSVDFVSTLTGRAIGPGELLDGDYWRRQARRPVAFRRAVETLAESGVNVVIEIGPHSVLGPMVGLAWPDAGIPAGPPVAIPSLLRPGRHVSEGEAADAFVAAAGRAYRLGLPVFFPGLFAGESRRRIALPGYPFQRERHWVKAARRRRAGADHPLLGTRHESASGEITFETELLPSDPEWLTDHRVFDRLVAPGALYGAMAVSACLAEGEGAQALEDMQLQSPLIFEDDDAETRPGGNGRKMQVLFDASEDGTSRRVRILSRSDGAAEWTLHAEGRTAPGASARGEEADVRVDVERLKGGLESQDVRAFYRARAGVGIDLGPSFRTLAEVWSRPGEAVAEVVVPEGLDGSGLEVHPLLLDGCFQVMSAARGPAGTEGGTTYLPFGWDRLWLSARIPERVICHARLREDPQGRDATDDADADVDDAAEVFAGDVRIYDRSGLLLGGLTGYTIKKATRATLLSAVEGLNELLYEVAWRDRPLPPGMADAAFLTDPAAVAGGTRLFTGYLSDEGVGAEDRDALLDDLERVSRAYALLALDRLGWERKAGAVVRTTELRGHLQVRDEHTRLFRRMLEMLARSGMLEETEDGFIVIVASGEPLPPGMPADADAYAARMAERYAHGSNEIGLFRRSGDALAEVLRGREDPLSLLFSSGEPTAADLYLKAPVARAANRMLADAIRSLLAESAPGRRLRVIEVGAGTGSATASVLPELPAGRFEYVYTDISAGFFAEAEARFADSGALIDYRVLDIEKDPVEQGFDAHGYDLLIASNVLHATRFLDETLAHCRDLLAPSGQLVALENLRGQGWLDLTFGQLDGWWRFADRYRPHHALAGPAVWRQVLEDADFSEVEVLGVDASDPNANPDRGVIVARGPVEVAEAPGVWIVAGDEGGVAKELARKLATRNQTVVLAGHDPTRSGTEATPEDGDRTDAAPVREGGARDGGPRVVGATLDMERREDWEALVNGLPDATPLAGIAHLAALDGYGPGATAAQMSGDARRATSTALALVQGAADSDAAPANGLWLVTRGGQVLEREREGQLSGALLWGFGKVVAKEAPDLRPRMLDLDPEAPVSVSDMADELLHPEAENHIAYRAGLRRVARLVRAGTGTERLAVPDGTDWQLEPDSAGALERMSVALLPPRALGPRDVRIAVEATGLNFWDVFRSIGFIDEGLLGGEMCGRVLEVGPGVSAVSVGDRIVGLAFGTFGPEAVTREEMVCPAPANAPATALATLPTAFVSADLSYELARLQPGDRVLIHAGAGGVGLAAIQLAQALGAEVFATASARKRDYLRSLGVEHVFDSRRTAFGKEILEATEGAGVDVVLNSLTGEGFIDSSLACLANGGRFIELARRDILSPGEMAAVRPDVDYHILELDTLKEDDPGWPGTSLKRVMERFAAGGVTPLSHTRWPLTEAEPAMRYMRAARHIGKIVFTTSPLARGHLRPDRTYLVTGGLGGIGCAVARWLADRGAGAIALNGRRKPDAEAAETIEALRARGITVRAELADVSDAGALDEMLARMERDLPPLGGVIHSVGVLSDQSLGNQSWDRFRRVLWPKVLGAWHLHRATVDQDLDMFVLFSSVAGVLGNAGQANHAAANAFLDQLAAHRRSLGLAGQSIAWGAWAGLGEAEEQRERIASQLAASGSGWISPQQGLRALERVVRDDPTTAIVAAVDWEVYGDAAESRSPLLEDLLATDGDGDADASDLADDLMATLRETPPAGREELLVSFLQQEVKAVLRLSASPSSSVAFFDLGMDSLMAVELRNRLNRAFAGEYVAPNTVVFDFPDIAGLAGHLAVELGAATPTAQEEPEREPGPRTRIESRDGAIAIVGMACRFPGAPDLAAFWRLLETGRDLVTEGRRDHGPWDGIAGNPNDSRDAVRRGAFLEDVDKFDARFFRITPIEAQMMDPRQRLLLETTWHALEDAGIDPSALRGSSTGVYVGVGNGDYRDVAVAAGENHGYLGTTISVTAGRIAFTFGLNGPAVPVDMACASSLAAVHQAVSALRQEEVELALVGGVNAILSPGIATFMREAGMLSKRGRCSAFDAGADGFVRGEGCGMVVLKRLRDAAAEGDRIWGAIRGSAVNQNGASAGLTIPNGPAQERVIEEALSRAGIAPGDVDYLEAHGAGSDLGDPIEVLAASAVYGRGREPARPLLVGSVKTNLGHQECAAGVASLIKAVLAMNAGLIPKHLHFSDPSPHLEWDQLPIRVASEPMVWPAHPDRPARAGVSAFGISGTNAHVVVEAGAVGESPCRVAVTPRAAGPARRVPAELPGNAVEIPPPRGDFARLDTRVLPLSGTSSPALRALAERYWTWLDQHEGAFPVEDGAAASLLGDMAWTAGVGRSHFARRAGVVFRDAESLRAGLSALLEADLGPEPKGMPAPPAPPRTAFVYAGEGSERIGMGRDFYAAEPVVRALLDRCDAVFGAERGGPSLIDVMFGRAGAAGRLDDPEGAQPAIYALACARTALWSSVGVRPAVVAGHGIGELAAAWAAGVVTLEDGLRIAAARGAAMSRPRVRMAAAAPAGDPSAPDRDPLAELEAACAGMSFSRPEIVMIGHDTGTVLAADAALDGEYWRRWANAPDTSLGPALALAGTLAEQDVELVFEIGARPGPGPTPLQVWSDGGDQPDRSFAESVARAYEAGLPISFAGLFAGEERRRISLPVYPFQRRRHWFGPAG